MVFNEDFVVAHFGSCIAKNDRNNHLSTGAGNENY